jgi:hypothetical protein
MMGLGTAYANVGFFGIPVTQLAFGPDYLIHQSVLTALMAIVVCTVGVWLLAPSGGKLGKLMNIFETPLIPSVALGMVLGWELPTVVSQALQFLGLIFTPLALYTLGADCLHQCGPLRAGPTVSYSGAEVSRGPDLERGYVHCHGSAARRDKCSGRRSDNPQSAF